MIRFYCLLFLVFLIGANFAQNPRIKVNYFVQDGKMISSLGVNGGACIERFIAGLGAIPTTTGNLEIRVHSLFKSSTGPSATTLNSCTGSTASGPTTGPGWSCENRCETATNAGKCGQWVSNGSQNSSYPGNPNYTDTSIYPCTDILYYKLKGFESDQTSSSNLQDLNLNDGVCGGTCTLASCYGNYQDPTSGDNNVLINIGQPTDTLRPFLGGVWSKLYQSDLESTVCNTDGFINYYYSRWKYRWCWDSTTLNASHAGFIKFPDTKEVCSGSTVIINDSTQAFEAARGFSEYQWQYSTDGINWSNISTATSKDLSTASLTNNTVNPINYSIRRAGLFCADFKPSGYRMFPVYTNTQIVVVYPQPIAPVYYSSSPGNGTTICKGTYTYAQFDPGTGGYTDAVDEFQYSINGGTTWATYNPGYSINTSTATTSVQIRGRHTAGSLSTCTASAWVVLATWPVSTQATPASISSSTPTTATAICLGDIVNASFNAGSGGTGDEFRYSIDNGSTWNTYISGINITTTSASGNVLIQTRRAGSTAPCLPSPWTAIGTWPVVNTPTAPTLNTQNPNTSALNIGDNFQVLANNGTGGSSDANDEFRYSIDGGQSWNTYTNNSSITVPTDASQIIVQSRRLAGNSSCPNTNWNNLVQWNVNGVLPVDLSAFYGITEGNSNHLYWQTQSEQNTAEFEIFKSSNLTNWSAIATIPAIGNSTLPTYYNYVDEYTTVGDNYYKLKIIDTDLSFGFSPIIVLKNNVNDFTPTLTIYPNPFKDKIFIKTIASQSTHAELQLINSIGAVVFKSEVEMEENKEFSLDLKSTTIEPGCYWLKFIYNGNVLIKKIIKQ